MSIERARDLRKQMPPAEAKLWLTLQTPERPATPTLMPSPQGGGKRRSRAIVEIGHRSIDDLSPPHGTVGADPPVVSLPSMGRDQGWGEPLAPKSNEKSP